MENELRERQIEERARISNFAEQFKDKGYRVLTNEEYERLIKPNELAFQEQASYVRKETAEKIYKIFDYVLKDLKLGVGETNFNTKQQIIHDALVDCQNKTINVLKNVLKTLITKQFGVEIKE